MLIFTLSDMARLFGAGFAIGVISSWGVLVLLVRLQERKKGRRNG